MWRKGSVGVEVGLIRFQDVTKLYPNATSPSLDHLNLQIEKGEFVFVVGASGAGKSTLIKLLYREELPTAGSVYLAGRNLASLRNGEVPYLRRNLCVIFQDFKLLPDRTVFDNVAFALEVTEAPRKEVMRRVPAALEMVGLRHKAASKPTELSGGEQQRVAVARAIVRNPVLLLADEPTGNLDPETSYSIMRLLLDINRMGATCVVATHAKNLVNELRQRVVGMENGRIVRDEQRGTYGNEY